MAENARAVMEIQRMATAAKMTATHNIAGRKSRPAPKGFKRPAQFSADQHIGINQVYARIKDGSLPHVRLGRTVLIPDDALDRLVTIAKP
jgi:excisionase family DNA binding protein